MSLRVSVPVQCHNYLFGTYFGPLCSDLIQQGGFTLSAMNSNGYCWRVAAVRYILGVYYGTNEEGEPDGRTSKSRKFVKIILPLLVVESVNLIVMI